MKVVIGTTALEMSLNFQASGFMINYDSMYNPARMTQLAGRIRRLGSEHKVNVFITLFTNGTVEENCHKRLPERQAVSDFVFGEASEFYGGLTDDQLMTIIRS